MSHGMGCQNEMETNVFSAGIPFFCVYTVREGPKPSGVAGYWGLTIAPLTLYPMKAPENR